jgi:hypothetical protein
MAGFEVAVAFPLVERSSGFGLELELRGPANPGMAGFAAPEPVIISMAGFALLSRRHLPGGHIYTCASQIAADGLPTHSRGLLDLS